MQIEKINKTDIPHRKNHSKTKEYDEIFENLSNITINESLKITFENSCKDFRIHLVQALKTRSYLEKVMINQGDENQKIWYVTKKS